MKTGGILLCAGFGTRLAPLSEFVPKPAIPFLGEPMAKYARRALEAAGVDAMGMNVHHLPDEMIHAMDDGKWSNGTRDLVISREGDAILGTGGGAARVARLMPDCDRFILYHGDVLCAADLADALASHQRSGAKVTLVILKRPVEIHENVRKSLGMIGVANDEVIQIRDWHKRGTEVRHEDDRDVVAFTQAEGEIVYDFEPRCFAGIHIVERSVLDAIDATQNVCLVTQIYRDMLERGERIHAYQPKTDVFFADVGTPATYLDAQRRCLTALNSSSHVGLTLDLFERKSVRLEEKDAVGHLVYGDVMVPQNVDLGTNVCLVEGAHVQPGESLNEEMRFARGGITASKTYVLQRIGDTDKFVRIELEK